ncbi:MAG: insulinase family protein [Actinobacteria bacterium]|nr:insulinase family protein [Actinomycetota bacterium]
MPALVRIEELLWKELTLNKITSEVNGKISSSTLKFDKYEVTEFDNGLRVVSEYIPHFRSISLGFWIGVGSRSETHEINGITHLIEHLLFKGTKTRSYRDIAIAFDSLGAEFNAFTDKENTCVYADFLDTHLDQCVELLFDVVFNPSFLPENIKTEKKIVLEEIKMVEDNPSDNIFNYFYKVILNGHPLSLPVLGTRKSLGNLDSDVIWQYFSKNFTLNNIVISAAGNIKHSDLIEAIKKHIESINNTNNGKKRSYLKSLNISNPEIICAKKIYKRKIKATHLCYGGIGCRRSSDDRFALSLLTNMIGGNMSSRLFQKVREEKGLSYSIFASNTQYIDTGVVCIYAASSPKNVYKVLDLIEEEIEDIKKNGVKEIELERAKENMKGGIVLNIEDISSRMSRLGKSLLMDNKILTIDEIMKKIDRVSLKDVEEVVHKYFQPERMSLVVMGDMAKGG